MTYDQAMAIAHSLANSTGNWYEVHTNGTDYLVLEAGDDFAGYEHQMSISPLTHIEDE